MPITHFELIFRIAVGAGLGAIIGYERDIHGRQVGLRTHLLVSMASTTFMVVSNYFLYFETASGVLQHQEADTSRIAASVVSAVGFLAGGAILKTGSSIQGLTTAAGLWLVTAIGLCAGAGMFPEAVAVTFMGLVALTFFRIFEDKNDRVIRRRVSITLKDHAPDLDGILAQLAEHGVRIPDFDYERTLGEKVMKVTFEARIPVTLGVRGIIGILDKQDAILRLDIRSD